MAIAVRDATFPTSIDIPENKRQEIVRLLNARLADTLDLKTQAKQAHWNVKGREFFQLHELFDQIAAHLEAHSDIIAERATALGGVAMGTARMAAANSAIPEYDLDATKGEEHVRALVQRLAKLGANVRAAIDRADELGDKSTADVFTEISRELDKDLWFLEAHVQA
ncbi:MAG: DNA starvation/stationary phase protection protein Dps [Acidobacteriia bacterium]|jgi:starvation-inducible DNA-binding protein|nr:DNA starvation/stationary phase protection protein Dps [Terriglobia bacterium]